MLCGCSDRKAFRVLLAFLQFGNSNVTDTYICKLFPQAISPRLYHPTVASLVVKQLILDLIINNSNKNNNTNNNNNISYVSNKTKMAERKILFINQKSVL